MLIRLARTYMRPYRTPILLVVLLQLIQTLATLALPTFNAVIIDNGVVKGDINYILRAGGIMLIVAMAQVVASVSAVRLAANTAMAFGRDIRAALFHRVMGFSAREMARFGTPSLITRTVNDVQQIQILTVLTFTVAVSAPITCIGGILLALNQNVQLTGLLVVIVPVLGVIIGVIISRMGPLYRLMQGRIDRVNKVLREQITGVRVIRAFVSDTRERDRFERANTELWDVSLRVGRLMAFLLPSVMLVINVSSVAVLWFGGILASHGRMQIGAFAAYLIYLLLILMSVLLATAMIVMLPRAEVCANRVQEVLGTGSSLQTPADAVRTPPAHGHLELRGVTFRYPGAEAPVLHGIDLVARPGEVTAIIGSTGSGKSTLLNLVPRLFDVTEGAVLIDDVDVRDFDPTALSGAIAFVPQVPYLFSGTVASNLRYGKPEATDDELWSALEVAQARDFVERMPDGLNAPISQGGTNVSGGQRQRLAIARALVHQPSVYLFDDSFSALDYSTDAALRTALASQTADKTVIIVAQRVSTIRAADRIVVLDQGRVVGSGTHLELMAANPTYREIVLSQLTEQEAA